MEFGRSTAGIKLQYAGVLRTGGDMRAIMRGAATGVAAFQKGRSEDSGGPPIIENPLLPFPVPPWHLGPCGCNGCSTVDLI